MNKRNDFLLPNELGWECNDEISALLDEFARDYMKCYVSDHGWMLKSVNSQYMDNIYAVIKKYQQQAHQPNE